MLRATLLLIIKINDNCYEIYTCKNSNQSPLHRVVMVDQFRLIHVETRISIRTIYIFVRARWLIGDGDKFQFISNITSPL